MQPLVGETAPQAETMAGDPHIHGDGSLVIHPILVLWMCEDHKDAGESPSSRSQGPRILAGSANPLPDYKPTIWSTAMNIRTLSSLIGIVFGLTWNGVATANQTPNHYDCTGKGAKLSLTVGSDADVGILPPQTTLDLQLGKKSYSYKDAEVETESTLIGDLWEVTLGHIPDLHIKHASVVIPTISLGEEPVNFKSQLILTTVKTPFIATPFVGVVNPSRYVDLNCTASMLFF